MVASSRVHGVESDVDVAVCSAWVEGKGSSWCCGCGGREHDKCEGDDEVMHLEVLGWVGSCSSALFREVDGGIGCKRVEMSESGWVDGFGKNELDRFLLMLGRLAM